MSRDLLKEAIADAKAVKETAIANAKAALAESFAPHLKELFAAKINELEEDEMEEGMEKKPMKKGKKEMEERLGTTNDPMGSYEHGNLEEDELEEEMELEELLKELAGDNEVSEEMEEEGLYEEEDEMGMEMGDEEIEGDLSDEKLEQMIQDVIADMIADEELVAGPNFGEEGDEGAEGAEGEEGDEDIDLEELLNGDYKKHSGKTKDSDSSGYYEPEETGSEVPKKFKDTSNKGYFEIDEEEDVDLNELLFELKKEKSKEMEEAKKKDSEKEKMKKDLEEAYDAIKTLRAEMNEVNLLNAKLLYTNKVFRSKNLTESQKVKVLETFDKATTVKEVKLVFESLSFDTKPSRVFKNSLRESLGSASKATGAPSKKPILEVNEQFSRMQKLAGIIK